MQHNHFLQILSLCFFVYFDILSDDGFPLDQKGIVGATVSCVSGFGLHIIQTLPKKWTLILLMHLILRLNNILLWLLPNCTLKR